MSRPGHPFTYPMSKAFLYFIIFCLFLWAAIIAIAHVIINAI